MVEFFYDAIRATAEEDIVIPAIITNDEGECITDACSIMLHTDDMILASVPGELVDGTWYFTIPAEITTGHRGRYWYCICQDDSKLCFRQPIYLI